MYLKVNDSCLLKVTHSIKRFNFHYHNKIILIAQVNKNNLNLKRYVWAKT